MQRIGVIGLGETGTLAVVSLLERGYSCFVLADDVAVSPFEPSRNTLFRPEDVGRARSEAVLSRLQALHPRAHFLAGSSPRGALDWYQDWLGECEICLIAADASDVQTLVAVNSACLDRGRPFLPAVLMGTVGQLGPWVMGDGGPCLGCFEMRVRTASGRTPFPPPVSPNPVSAARLARELAQEASRYFEQGCSLRARGAVQYLWGNDSVSTHPVLRCPECPHCGGRSPRMPFTAPGPLGLREGPSTDARYILSLTPRLVDPVTGPITSLAPFTPGPMDPALSHWVAVVAEPAWEGFGLKTVQCGGNALLSDVARAAALGEAVERSSTCHASFGDLIVARHCELGVDALDPLCWDLFDDQTRSRPDFPFVVPSRTTEMSWVWGYSLTNDNPVRVPASRVFCPYRAVAPGDATDGPIISGYATGVSLEEAVYAAMMEVIERDAFMVAWANQLAGSRLAIDASSRGEVGSYLSAIESRGIEVRCVLLDLDLGAHTVVAIARDSRPGEPASVVAAAADVDAAAACRRALKELTANRLNVRHEMQQLATLPAADPEVVVDERLHGLLFAREDMVPRLNFWWDSSEEVGLPEPPAETSAFARLRKCVAAITTAGLQVVVIDLTPPSIAALGLRVVKVLVPGTYPMNFDGRFPHFGGQRMVSAPVAAGLRAAPLAVEDLCRIPHPFP